MCAPSDDLGPAGRGPVRQAYNGPRAREAAPGRRRASHTGPPARREPEQPDRSAGQRLGRYQPPCHSGLAARRLYASILACLRLSSRHWISDRTRINVGKNAITMNIVLVITLSFVSPYQPSPPSARANAAGAIDSNVTLNTSSAVMKRRRRMVPEAYLTDGRPGAFRFLPWGAWQW